MNMSYGLTLQKMEFRISDLELKLNRNFWSGVNLPLPNGLEWKSVYRVKTHEVLEMNPWPLGPPEVLIFKDSSVLVHFYMA